MTIPLIDRSRALWLFGAAGVSLLAAQAALPALPDDDAAKVATVAAHRAMFGVSAAAFLAAAVLLIAATTAINTLAVQRARGLTRLGLLLTGVGALWPVAGRATFNIVMLAISGGADHQAAVQAAHAIDNSGAFWLLLITLLAFALGPIVLTIGLWRAGVAPVWPAVLWLVGVLVVNASEADSRPLSALGMAVAATGLAWLGATVAHRRVRAANRTAQTATA